MTNPYRHLCAELVEQVQRAINDHGLCLEASDALMHRARALMAQPEPEGPTDEELMAVFWEHENGLEELWAADWPTAARAILDRWGTPNLAQVRSSLGDGSAVSDEEIMELMPQQMRDDLAAAARALAGFDRANVKAAGAMRIILNRHAVDHVRAVLAKYGSTTPQLVAEGPTDDKLMDIARANDLVYYMGKDCGFASPYMEETDITAEVLAYARAVLAKWGHQ